MFICKIRKRYKWMLILWHFAFALVLAAALLNLFAIINVEPCFGFMLEAVLLTWECFHCCWGVFTQHECLFCSSFCQQEGACIVWKWWTWDSWPHLRYSGYHVMPCSAEKAEGWRMIGTVDCQGQGGHESVGHEQFISFASFVSQGFVQFPSPSSTTLLSTQPPQKLSVLICAYLNSWAFELLFFWIFSHHMKGKSVCVVLSCLLGLKQNSSLCIASHCSVFYWVNKLVPHCQRLK